MAPHPSLAQRSQAAVWHPCTQMKWHADGQWPLLGIVRGQGPWLYDEDGHRYLDAISSWWTNLFGHANAHINAALRDQLERIEHVMLAGFTHAPVVELSERLRALSGGVLGHAFYASDGASATEIALKMSFHYWRNSGHPDKSEFACLAGGYHGETVGALAVTDVALFRDAYAPLVRPAHVLPSPDTRLGDSPLAAADAAALELESFLDEYHPRIAALIVEPLVQCAGGMAMHHHSYLRRARELCRRYRVHLIADEIAVGCGRSGTFFASEQALGEDRAAQDWPDFICLSKGISGGYLPLSLVLTRDEVYAAFLDDGVARAFLHSHSYTGNALACRAALATLDLFDRDQVLVRNRRWGEGFSRALAPLLAHPRVRHLRRTGMIWAFDVADADPAFSRRYYREALARELLLRPIGHTVYVMPPYVLDDDQGEWLATRIIESLDAALFGH